MSTALTMEISDYDSVSVCSTISSDTYREKRTTTGGVGWSEDNQAKLDAVWQARADVDTAKEVLDYAEEILSNATRKLHQAMRGVPTLKARFLPPRALQTAKAHHLEAKSNAKLARLRLNYCHSVLERKRLEGCKLGIDVRPVPELIRVASTVVARGA